MPNAYPNNCSLPCYRWGWVQTLQTRAGDPPLLWIWQWIICNVFSPDFRLLCPVSYAPMCISHTHAVQHTALSASDLGSPTTSFQCLKSQKGSEALELCFVQQTLLPCSRSCAGSRISRSGLMQCSPSLAGSPDPTQGQTCQIAHSADMPVLFMMFRGTGKGTYIVI